MAATGKVLVVLGLFLFPIWATADTCLGPQVTSESYTTTEVTSSYETVFIIKFSVTCKNGLKGMNLYADIGGKTIPAAKLKDANQYQISVTDEHKNLPAGSYDMRVFDEEGYAAVRKAQRSGESTESISPLATISLKHAGVWKGPMLQSEFVASAVALLVFYFAYTAKTRLQA